MQGKASDLELHAREILRQRDQLVQIYATHTGRSPEQVATAIERDNFMTTEQARDFGLLDHIISRRTQSQ